ncbi:MAG TPA: hypothetical protein VKS98_13505 [Chthoniobacterales bacterium]|nr:hypothetical protein [Chthoniobacterales bacterium]
MKAFFTVVSLCSMLVIPFSVAQTPQPNAKLLELVKEVEAQQAQITDNQGKIETKLAAIGDTIRVSRIFSSRSN